LTESPETLQSENTVDKNAPGNPKGVSNGKPVLEFANCISAVRRKIEVHFANTRQNITSLEIENWQDIASYFKSLDSMTPDKIMDIYPPIPVFKVNNISIDFRNIDSIRIGWRIVRNACCESYWSSHQRG